MRRREKQSNSCKGEVMTLIDFLSNARRLVEQFDGQISADLVRLRGSVIVYREMFSGKRRIQVRTREFVWKLKTSVRQMKLKAD
jgi:hypothetical protein